MLKASEAMEIITTQMRSNIGISGITSFSLVYIKSKDKMVAALNINDDTFTSTMAIATEAIEEIFKKAGIDYQTDE